MFKPPHFLTVGGLESPSAGWSRASCTQARPTASTGGPPTPTTLPSYYHPADPSFQEPQASQAAACRVLFGSHTPGSAYHHGERADLNLTVCIWYYLKLLSYCLVVLNWYFTFICWHSCHCSNVTKTDNNIICHIFVASLTWLWWHRQSGFKEGRIGFHFKPY